MHNLHTSTPTHTHTFTHGHARITIERSEHTYNAFATSGWKCTVQKSNMYDFDSCGEWGCKTHAECEQGVSRTKVVVKLNLESVEHLWPCLTMDTRKTGMRGRTIGLNLQYQDVTGAPVVLQKHDRLELGGSVTDIHNEAQELQPKEGAYELVVFRKHADVPLTKWSPLFAAPFFKYSMLTVDVLHCFDLGVCQCLHGHLLKQLLLCGALGNSEHTVVGFKAGLKRHNRLLRNHYRSLSSEQLRQTTKVQRVTLKMLGLGKSLARTAILHVKGHEGRCLTPFMDRLARQHQGMLPQGPHLAKSCQRLTQFYNMLGAFGWTLTQDESTRLTTTVLRMCKSAQRAGVHLTPKWHQAVHVAAQSGAAGNPAFYSAYEDESMNKSLRDIIKACAWKDCAGRLLSRFRLRESFRAEEQ